MTSFSLEGRIALVSGASRGNRRRGDPISNVILTRIILGD